MKQAKKPFMKRKSTQAMLAAVVTLGIIFAGTFAWYSFNQRATNEFNIKVPPDVNLHDDFEGGPDKDVYVENSGQRDVFVRVRLSEYMEIGGISLVNGAIKDDPNTWTKHIPNANGECFTCIDNPRLEWFHSYYEWTMGGRKIYRPAEDAAKGVGRYDEAGYIEPQDVGDATNYKAQLESAFASDPASLALITKFYDYTQVFTPEDYEALETAIKGLKDSGTDVAIWTETFLPGEENDSEGNPKVPQVQYLSDLKLTQTGDVFGTVGGGNDPYFKNQTPPMVISMEQWREGTGGYPPFAKGDFWVIDTDGWAYWANPLKPGDATGLLLSYVDRTAEYPADDAYYAIDVWLQAVTADEIDLFGKSAELNGGGGITNNGTLMMKLNSGDYVYDTETSYFYYDHGNNVFTRVNSNTLALEGGKFIGGPNGEKGAAAITSTTTSIAVRNFIAEKTEAVVLKGTLNIVVGRNGMSYIDLGDGSYAVTIEWDESKDPDAPYTPYRVIGLGENYHATDRPFVQVWPGDGGLPGAGNDVYENPYVKIASLGAADDVDMRYFGNGVYVKTAWDAGAGKYIDDLSTYYITDAGVSAVEGYESYDTFELKLKTGDLFRFEPGVGFGAAGEPGTDEYTFEFAGMIQGTNGQWYIATADVFTNGGDENPQGENTLITLNPDASDNKLLGSNNNVLVWAKNPGTDDQYSAYSEPFLKGVKKADLLPGGNGFSADGATWKVLDVDQYGNRLLLCDTADGSKVTMGKSLYSQSNVKAEMQNIMKTLPTISQYALPVNLPVWYRQLTTSGGTDSKINPLDYTNKAYNFNVAELSSPKNINNWSTLGAEGFALSLSEAIKYKDAITYCNDSWWLRSAGKIIGCGTKLDTPIDSSTYYQMTEPRAAQICGTHDGLSFVKDSEPASTTRDIHTMGAYTDSFRCRVAMWVRFSDADKVAASLGGLSWDDFNKP